MSQSLEMFSIADMATEIERKFLLLDNSWRDSVHDQKKIVQGYLANAGLASVRVRISGEKANLNIKSMTIGVSRTEYEYPIPLGDAEELLKNLCRQPLIEKTRYYLKQAALTWEIDVFEGNNSGLVVAEIELYDPDQVFFHPNWLGQEVSGEERYYNVALVDNPYKNW